MKKIGEKLFLIGASLIFIPIIIAVSGVLLGLLLSCEFGNASTEVYNCILPVGPLIAGLMHFSWFGLFGAQIGMPLILIGGLMTIFSRFGKQQDQPDALSEEFKKTQKRKQKWVFGIMITMFVFMLAPFVIKFVFFK